MTTDNLTIWNKVKQPPQSALKPINFGYLKGKSDISPQWRLMAMTQAFGPVGHGWTYRIVRTWSERVAETGAVMCFSEVAVKTKFNDQWGEEFFGIGGSEIVEKNKNGLAHNDEGYKKATTDALGVAFKAVGVAADIYFGNFDGTKYVYDIQDAYHNEDEIANKFEKVKERIAQAVTQAQLMAIYKEFTNTEFKDRVKEMCAARKQEFTAQEFSNV